MFDYLWAIVCECLTGWIRKGGFGIELLLILWLLDKTFLRRIPTPQILEEHPYALAAVVCVFILAVSYV